MGWAKDVIFREDFFERVVDVKWAVSDGVFVAGDYWGGTHCGEIKSKKESDQKWSGGLTEMFGENGDIEGCSFAMVNDQPVFVVVGNFNGEGPPKGQDPEDPPGTEGWYGGSLIMVSNDGLSWRHAMHKYSRTLFVTSNGCFLTHSMWGVVWDGNAFYAQELFMHDSEDGEDADAPSPVKERIYSSSDGESWSMVSETFMYDGNTPGNAPAPKHKTFQSGLSRYCKQRKNKGGIPDGLQGYDKASKILIKPASLNGFCIQGPLYDGDIHWNSTPSSEVEITLPNGETKTSSVGGACYAVAAGSNLWAAALGGGSVSLSFNRGKKWENSYSGGKEKMLTICGAKYKDIFGDKK